MFYHLDSLLIHCWFIVLHMCIAMNKYYILLPTNIPPYSSSHTTYDKWTHHVHISIKESDRFRDDGIGHINHHLDDGTCSLLVGNVLEDKAQFLVSVGRAYGDDEVRYVSYVSNLEYDACDVSLLYLMTIMFYIVYFMYRWWVFCVIDNMCG